ncbi:MAG: hypothetical protein ACRDCE_20800 [Cetobacterium sp.]|uniref:hypothetical protein n=1 Tax=Cetobacterium sp. TaxID=2071632 RepID=UPI003EE5C7A8
MKMWIELDNYNRVSGFSFIENDKMKEIETDLEIDINNFKNYILENGVFVYSKLPPKPSLLHTKYNGTEWVIEASLEEQVEYYKNLIIQKTRELGIENLAGFGNPNLELELNELKKIHLEKTHELALQFDNRLK